MAQRIDVSIEHKGAPAGRRRSAATRTPAPPAARTTARTSSSATWASARSAATISRSRARERIEQLADAGSFAEEDADLRSADPLGFFDLRPYTERLAEAELKTGEGDAIVIGRAEIEAEACQLSVMDFGFMGGSMGSVVGEKFVRACEQAVERRVPLVSVTASGGARMQEGILSLMQLPKTVCAVEDLHDAARRADQRLRSPDHGAACSRASRSSATSPSPSRRR